MVDYSLEHVKVLIVDDNMNMRSMVKSVLHSLGVRQITLADDGEKAFEQMRIELPDVVFCDWVMQPINGPMFVRRIRQGKDSPNPYVPIIMLTGYSDEERVLEARDIGVNEFLAKPISAAKLYIRMKSVIESDRKFIKTKEYFGPDRRRHIDKFYSGAERRNATKQDASSKEKKEGAVSNE